FEAELPSRNTSRGEYIMNNQDELSRAQKVAKAKLGFIIHLTAYVVVNAILIAINLTTSTQHLWFKWPLLGWGIGILAHALALFALTSGPGIKQWMVAREMKKRTPPTA